MGFIRIPGVDISDANAVLGEVLNPKTFYSVAPPRKTGTMPTVALDPASNAYPAGYHAGDPLGLSHVDTDLHDFNIVYGVTIFGVSGIFGYFDRFYKLEILSSKGTSKPTLAGLVSKNAQIGNQILAAYADDPASYIRLIQLAINSTKSLSKPTVAGTVSKNTPVGTDISILVDGFVEETAAAVQTDKTAQARSGAIGDLNLCPMTPALNDKIYIGCALPFYRVWVNYSQAGAGNWSNGVYYWNGAWVAALGVDDQTSDFQATAGIRRIDHTPQGDWVVSVILGMNLYWLMVRTDAFVNQTVAPLGSQVFVSIA
jgi:hypothetical protein